MSGLGFAGFGDAGDAGISGALGGRAGPAGDGDLPQPAAMTLNAMPANANLDVLMDTLLLMLVEQVRRMDLVAVAADTRLGSNRLNLL